MTRKRFLPAVNVRWAKLLDGKPPFIDRKKSKGRFAVGVRYERRFQEHMGLTVLGSPSLRYLEGPWIEFKDQNGRRWCQADGILLDETKRAALIYEVKYQHTLQAWWQLTHLYEPVVRVIFPGWTICCMEVCHWHDPSVSFPQGYDLTQSPLQVPHSNRLAVCVFNPKRAARVQPLGYSSGKGNSAGGNSHGSEETSQRSVGAAGQLLRGDVDSRGRAVPAGAEGSTSITLKGD